MLTFKELREINVARCSRWHPGGLADWGPADWFVAVVGELGEAANVAKKLKRSEDGIVGNDVGDEELRQQLADEIADTAIYLDLLAARCGIDLEDAIRDKFNRVSERNGFPERILPKRRTSVSSDLA